MDNNDDIQIIADNQSPESTAPTTGVDYKHIVLELGNIGRTLADTYSENNQNTGEGFVAALEVVERLSTMVLNAPESELPIKDKDSLNMLLTYLRGKLQRRVKAVDGNAVNA